MDEYTSLLTYHDGNGGQRALGGPCHRFAVQIECTAMTRTPYTVIAEFERASGMRASHRIGPQVHSFVTYDDDGFSRQRQRAATGGTEDLVDRTEIDGPRMSLHDGPDVMCENRRDGPETRHTGNADQYFSS